MEEPIQGKHFSITDSQGVKTVVYLLDEREKNLSPNAPKFTVEKLDYTEELVGERTKKTFYVNDPDPEGNSIVLLSFGKEKVVINLGLIKETEVTIIKKPVPINFQTLYSEKEFEYRDVEYTPNLKRPISIIDPETTEEIKPLLYFDETTNEIKGKCKLKPYKSYFAFEIKESN